jgi:molecular chaperone DnaK (HSP70)
VASRYLIGIDLGTTNSVLAYIDTQSVADGGSPIRVFPVPQLVAHGEVCTLPALPSFLYFPTQDELSTGAVCATWTEDPPMVTGVHAREQGALVPNRQVSSAKSWLSYPGIDRRARILPAQAEPPQPMISPIEASARYLMHLRDAWNGAMGKDAEARFENQEIVLTVPASFYEDARELTVEAARTAGIETLTLLEEPLAAFYAWIETNRKAEPGDPSLHRHLTTEGTDGGLKDGGLILICDIGGGTSDFSLVRTRRVNDELAFERAAIGEHLLLGGDNLDSALAHHVEERLGNIKLTLRQRHALRRACCAAKEQLLRDSHLDHVSVTILGAGRAVVGHSLSVDVTRDEVVKILTDGFLPIAAPDDLPARGHITGLRELGLPYASDPAITRHLAAFLTQAAATMNPSSAVREMVRPDAVLFNGGFCAPTVTRERIIEAISAWFRGAKADWRPKVLDNNSVESSVARGAAYYGRVRRGIGLRIGAGSARTYYIGLRSDDSLEGICVLPAGVNEGTMLPLLDRDFSVLANRPVSFTLFSSRTRHDAHGDVVALDEADVDRHPPLVTMLRYGRRLRERRLNVRLRASFTEVGTLELWFESPDTPHRWRLQFELRGEGEEPEQQNETKAPSGPGRSSADSDSDTTVESALSLIRDVFSNSGQDATLTPETLVTQLEATLGTKRDSWPLSTIRRLTDALIMVAEGRKQSPRHEIRWLNLCGFCLRPGLGAQGDASRVKDLLAIVSNQLAFEDELQCQVQLLVLLRRIAGGIPASSQHALFRKQTSPSGHKKSGRANRQLEYEKWRLLASLEHLLATARASFGEKMLARIRKEPDDAICLWSLGRLGARIPLYGPLHSVVSADTAGEWLTALLDLPSMTTPTQSAIVMLARCTDDPSRDVDHRIREQAITRLTSLGAAADVELLSKYLPPEGKDAVRSFGESLPPGLQVIGSSTCLLSVPALSAAGSSPQHVVQIPGSSSDQLDG